MARLSHSAAIVALAFAACDRSADRTRPAASAAVAAQDAPVERSGPPPNLSGTPLGFAVSPIDTLTTLGAWAASHPADVVQDSVPQGALSEHICRIARADAAMGARHFTRKALFSPPEPPAGELLPDTTHLAERYCILRGVWLVTVEPDSSLAVAFADSVARLFDASLGASTRGVRMSGMGTGAWTHGRSWTGPGTRVVLGLNVQDPPDDAGDGTSARPAIRGTQVIIVVLAPNSGLRALPGDSILFGDDGESAGERNIELAGADSALSWAGIPALTAALRPAIAQFNRLDSDATFGAYRSPAFDSALVRSAVIVHDALPSLTPARRAAAMVAVDMVLHHTMHSLNTDSTGADANLRRALETAGAAYEFEHLGDGYFYKRDWLWDAYHQDSLGRAGHLAFLSLVASGWGTRPGCAGNPGEKEGAQQHAEAALARGDDDPMIRYYLGLMEQDVVALAAGGMWDEYIDAKEYKPLAPAARIRAIGHLRVALRGLTERRMRRHAWRTAVALMLGHAVETRFLCIND